MQTCFPALHSLVFSMLLLFNQRFILDMIYTVHVHELKSQFQTDNLISTVGASMVDLMGNCLMYSFERFSGSFLKGGSLIFFID